MLEHAPSRPSPAPAQQTLTIAVVGLGYVGLPTALSLLDGGQRVIGFDISAARIQDIRAAEVDLLDTDHARLARALDDPRLLFTDAAARLTEADVLIVCVPTPVDEHHQPDLCALRGACATVVDHARPGQTIVLTSTSYVGSTRELVGEPLRRRGLEPGVDVHVAFSPERIDPGVAGHQPEFTPRIVGGLTDDCTARAAAALRSTAKELHLVSSAEAAEMAKLLENSFRAINLAFVNEIADTAGHLGLDITEVIDAAATKPFGFMAFRPGPGVGGHCIPCDPHYLAAPMRAAGAPLALTEQAMRQIAARPGQVAGRALALCGAADVPRILLVGLAYKPGVADVRESPSMEIFDTLRAAGAAVAYHDPLIASFEHDGRLWFSAPPDANGYDLAVLLVRHRGLVLGWLDGARVLAGTYRLSPLAAERI